MTDEQFERLIETLRAMQNDNALNPVLNRTNFESFIVQENEKLVNQLHENAKSSDSLAKKIVWLNWILASAIVVGAIATAAIATAAIATAAIATAAMAIEAWVN